MKYFISYQLQKTRYGELIVGNTCVDGKPLTTHKRITDLGESLEKEYSVDKVIITNFIKL